MNSLKNLWIALAVVFIISVIGVFTPLGKNLFGALPLSNLGYNAVADQGLTIGTAGTRFTQVLEGTCSLIIPAGNTSATSTQVADCAITGVQSGDTVFISLATTTPLSPEWGATSAKWVPIMAKASTTSGYITGIFLNQTGTTANLGNSGIASSVPYLILR